MDATVVVNSGLLLVLADILAGDWALPTVHLFINDVDPGPGAVVADFDEATFTGSTAQAIGAWGEAFMAEDGAATSVAPQLQWDWDSGVAETVYGVYVLSAGVGTPLLGYARFETPIGMAVTSNSLAVVPSFAYSEVGAGRFRTTAPYVG